MSVPGPPFEDPHALPGMGTDPHTVHVHDDGGPEKWLLCQDCWWSAYWDGKGLEILIPGDPRFGHGGSW